MERPHKCPECDYTSSDKASLKIHIMGQHTDERPHQCKECNYKCIDKTTLTNHIRSQHSGK